MYALKLVHTSRYPKCVRWSHSHLTISSSSLGTSTHPSEDQPLLPEKVSERENTHKKMKIKKYSLEISLDILYLSYSHSRTHTATWSCLLKDTVK